MSKTHHVIAMYWRRQQYVLGGCLICPGSFEQMFSDSLSETEESSPEREGDGASLSSIQCCFPGRAYAKATCLQHSRRQRLGGGARGPPQYQDGQQKEGCMSPYLSGQAPICGPDQSLSCFPKEFIWADQSTGGPASNRGRWVRSPGPHVSVALGDGARSDEVPELPVHVVGLRFTCGPTSL